MTAALWLVLAVIVAAGGWYVSVRLWPNSPCRACGGSGRNAGSTSRRWGTCRRCSGSGKRLRPGARMIERHRNRR